MILKIRLLLFIILNSFRSFSQDSLAIDSVKKILNERYKALAEAMDERNLEKMLSFILKTPFLASGFLQIKLLQLQMFSRKPPGKGSWLVK
jgi:hypothetical protein